MRLIVVLLAFATAELKPPGDCTKELHSALQARVNAACQGERMKCMVEHSCDQLRLQWYRFQDCARARYDINLRCFRGGDSGHLRALQSIIDGKNRCEALLAAKNCPKVCP